MEKFFYRVEKGDTVVGLSARFDIPPIFIVRDNGLKREIAEGDIIFIEKRAGRIYDALPFDTIESVAERFGVLPDRIREANGVDYLFYGLKIVIPLK